MTLSVLDFCIVPIIRCSCDCAKFTVCVLPVCISSKNNQKQVKNAKSQARLPKHCSCWGAYEKLNGKVKLRDDSDQNSTETHNFTA